ncbi:MAG TPA: hypothetical protein DCR11_03695 [Deltaproteobacteria bacterium]|nr:hypothetical protein [Deltaproteobacteria bacterium]
MPSLLLVLNRIRGVQVLGALLWLLAASLFYPAGRVAAQSEAYAFETRYATIRYSDEADLLDFGKKTGGASVSLVRDRGKALSLIKENTDRIVFRVKALLDMHPELHFNISVHKSPDEVSGIYKDLGMTGAPPIAFYAHKSHTIFLSPDRLSDGIFAHEVAHAVINCYFAPPPPPQVQEILAQYVDKHLWGD